MITCEIDGIEVEIDCTYYVDQPPMPNADNPDDFYGYTDIEFDLLDLVTGQPLDLEVSMDDEEAIRQLIIEDMNDE